MDLDSIGAALKRKLGPLPVWVWAILGGIVVYFLRSRGYFGSTLGTDTGTTLQPSQRPTDAPQAQTVLQPGESIYDPNSGALSTAPGGDTGAGGAGVTGSDPTQAIEDLAAAISSGQTVQSAPTNATAPRTSLLARAKAAVVTGRIGPKERARLRKEGFTNSQINFHLKRKTALGAPKPRQSGSTKPAHAAPKPTTKSTTHKTRPRSATHTRTTTGGRTTGRKGKSAPSLTVPRAATGPAQSRTRQRPTVGITRRTAPVQHPVSSHAAAQQSTAAPAHRPSQPPTRTVRQPPKSAPRPKKRGR